MRLRTSNHCFSVSAVTSVPNKTTRPCMGRNKPSAVFNSTVFPLPAAPSTMSVSPLKSSKEMLRSTGVSSKAKLTLSKASCGVWGSGMRLLERDEHAADDERQHDNPDAGHNHRARSRDSHPLRTALGFHPVKATH